jgi:hypothetical protein
VLAASVAAEFAYQSQKAHYNDDQRCAYGELSRDQRCGVYRGRANVARVMATGGYIGAGVLAAASALLFSISFEPSSAPASPEALRAGEPWIALEPGDARFGWRGSW